MGAPTSQGKHGQSRRLLLRPVYMTLETLCIHMHSYIYTGLEGNVYFKTFELSGEAPAADAPPDAAAAPFRSSETSAGRSWSVDNSTLTPRSPACRGSKSAKSCSSPLTPPMFTMAMGMPLSLALLTSLQAEYVASDVPTTSNRPAPSMASSAAVLTSAAMLSPNMTTAGLRIPAVLGNVQAPWESTRTACLRPSGFAGGSARHRGQAGYLKVV
ncbi:hypothetical protein TCAP_02999 [Tolypocladium capitatum]|uniref:Uncharacterized protein n=1 Tax=Tolypocladium capitatum TaxID=45235 RepID=A0A2K3QHN9_9HYPO|nr:hypothetical protein TCAP_02999 [Tolypocladium capitatum]